MRSEFLFHSNRNPGGDAKRRASLGMTAGAAAALGALAGCGSDDGGGGTTPANTTPVDNGTFMEGTFTGTTGDNTIDQSERGMALSAVDAGEGNDEIVTGEGDQVITGGEGDDTIDGGAGEDTAVYTDARAFYTVTEVRGEGVATYLVVDSRDDSDSDGTDTLTNIENLRFVDSGDDVPEIVDIGIAEAVVNIRGHSADETDLVGGAGNNIIEGGGGSDVITGGAGDDTIHGFLIDPGEDSAEGGGDVDIAAYAGDRDSFTVTATIDDSADTPVFTLTVTDTGGVGESNEGVDRLTSIEQLRFNSDGAAGEEEDVTLVFGTNAEDPGIEGTAADDMMFGFSGDDMFEIGAGDDTIDGGDGTDTAVFSGERGDYRVWMADAEAGEPSRFFVLHEDSEADVDEGRNTLINVEMIEFGDGVAVELNADLADDDAPGMISTAPSTGNDMLAADASGGEIEGQGGDDTFTSGDGDDVFYGNTDTTLQEETGDIDKVVFANALDDYSISAELHDFGSGDGMMTNVPRITVTGQGTDRLVGIESLEFGPSGELVTLGVVDEGTAGADILLGDENSNRDIEGLAGDDFIFGFGRDDTIDGGAGDDTIHGGGGDDTIDGGDGDDTAVYARERSTYTVTEVRGATADATTYLVEDSMRGAAFDGEDSLSNVENLRFADGAIIAIANAVNVIRGNDNGETDLMGGDGEDTIEGGGGDDTIGGGAGNDTIEGGAGNDTIDGGDGDDIAVYTGVRASYTVTEVRGAGVPTYLVVDSRNSADSNGSDTLTNIENLRFVDSGDDVPEIVNIGIAEAVTNIRGHTVDETDLEGGDGNNIIEGGGGSDVITGGLGNDTIHGFLIMPASGATEAVADMDTAAYAGDRDGFTVTAMLAATSGAAPVVTVTDIATTGAGEVNEGTDTLTSIERLRFNSDGAASEQVNVGLLLGTNAENTRLDGGGGADIIFGFAGNDTINAGGGDDTINGGEGIDIINGGEGDDSIDAGADNDTINGGEGRDTINGGEGRDTINGDGGDDTIDGGEGVDTIDGGAGVDTIDGGAGVDTIDGGGDGDTIDGGVGDDTIDGGGGDDTIEGGVGDDTIDGGMGDDTAVFAGEFSGYDISAEVSSGAARLIVEDIGTDALDEGTDNLVGIETIRFGSDSLAVVFDFQDSGRTSGNDEIIVGDDGDNGMDSARVNGEGGVDRIFGLGGEDHIDGGSENDHIYGGSGNDHLYGGSGNDHINGGLGNDTIDGGAGMDTVHYAERERPDYYIWQDASDPNTIYVRDKDEDTEGDEGTDTLTNVEMIMFGVSTDQPLALTDTVISFDTDPDNTNGDEVEPPSNIGDFPPNDDPVFTLETENIEAVTPMSVDADYFGL